MRGGRTGNRSVMSGVRVPFLLVGLAMALAVAGCLGGGEPASEGELPAVAEAAGAEATEVELLG